MSGRAEATSNQPHHAVLSLEVTSGFLTGARFDFADGLNCLIDGRGTGKTTVLEFLRFALGLMPDQRAAPSKYRTVDTLVKANLAGGQLKGHRPDQERHAVHGGAIPFGAAVGPQRKRRRDETSGTIARELEAIDRQLAQTAGELQRHDQQIEDLRASASETTVLTEKLKALAPAAGPDAALLTKAHTAKALRVRESLVCEQLIMAIGKASAETSQIALSFTSSTNARLDQERRLGLNAEIVRSIETNADTFANALASYTRSVAESAQIAVGRLNDDGRLLADRHAAQEAAYRELLSKSDEEGGRSVESAARTQIIWGSHVESLTETLAGFRHNAAGRR